MATNLNLFARAQAIAGLIAIFCLTTPLRAESNFPLGTFQVVNSAGFVEENGIRQPLELDQNAGVATIGRENDGTLLLEINNTQIGLFPVANGLDALSWDAEATALLHDVDIQALLGESDRAEIPVWGARVDWPGNGTVEIVLLPLGIDALTGFVISHPGEKTVVRQMEFRQTFGPANRPEFSHPSHEMAANADND
ncbi:hypothetical protein [Roseibium aggregatum]|uniref:Uncharacterized protein n=1 Tax=Roseibium aggregatum TaxID=187304 RepID=A0A939J4N5_9HYPH|nr:hypothetical protein [Roseibium aggregatum]MBN9670889.1 hypothetical protein [Roseibium aggregatum]